jgi:hypothetical protein
MDVFHWLKGYTVGACTIIFASCTCVPREYWSTTAQDGAESRIMSGNESKLINLLNIFSLKSRPDDRIVYFGHCKMGFHRSYAIIRNDKEWRLVGILPDGQHIEVLVSKDYNVIEQQMLFYLSDHEFGTNSLVLEQEDSKESKGSVNR